MLRFISVLLSVLMLLSLFSCASEENATETLEEVTESETKVEKDKIPTWKPTAERKYEKVETPLTPERLAQIPVANSKMTIQELRQICVDYVCLSVSFQWIPNSDFEYRVVNQGASASFLEGQLYGGIPYVNTASGNLYRVLECYDTETGIFDVTAFKNNNLLWGTACSGTACWGWQRVINSAKMTWTSGMTVKNGFIRVGDYTYNDNTELFGENNYDDCKTIAKKNGKDVMYEAYAKMKMADCLVNNGHVRMCAQDPFVVKNEDGSINPKESYVIQCEQGLYTTSEKHDRYTSDGTKYKIQGNDNYYCNFETLFQDGYLPHTFAEFLGTDPVEDAVATIEYTDQTATANDLLKCKLSANYAISHIVTTVCDAQGNQVMRYVKYMDNHFTKTYPLVAALPGNALQTHQTAGTNTVTLQVQLSTGQLITIYSGTLAA